MSGITIKRCGCKGNPSDSSDYQDKKYGQGMRVCNLDLKKTSATCSVCGKSHKL